MDENEIGTKSVQARRNIDAQAPVHKVIHIQGDCNDRGALLSERSRPCVDQCSPRFKVVREADIQPAGSGQSAEVCSGKLNSSKVALHGAQFRATTGLSKANGVDARRTSPSAPSFMAWCHAAVRPHPATCPGTQAQEGPSR